MMPIVAAIIIAALILWIIKLRAKVKHWRTAYIKMRTCYRLENKRRKAAQAITKDLLKADTADLPGLLERHSSN